MIFHVRRPSLQAHPDDVEFVSQVVEVFVESVNHCYGIFNKLFCRLSSHVLRLSLPEKVLCSGGEVDLKLSLYVYIRALIGPSCWGIDGFGDEPS